MKKGYLILAAAAAVLLFLGASRMAPPQEAERSEESAPPNFVPVQMEIRSGGYLSGGVSLALENGSIKISKTYRSASEDASQTITPSPEAWKNFFDACNALNIWNWQKSYVDPAIMDGHQWSVVLAYANKAIESSGSNSYPPSGQSIAKGRTAEFTAFCDAVNELVGEKIL